MKARQLILIGLFSFLAFLMATAPVATLYPRLVPPGSPLSLSALSGSVFAGSAEAVSYEGRTLARPLNWRFNPLALIAARLGFHVDGSVDGAVFDGQVARTLGGNLIVSSLTASGSVKDLMVLSGKARLPIDGEVGIKVDKLTVADRFAKDAAGEISIDRLRWALGRNPLVLGDFRVTVSTEAGVIVARVAPTAGPLDVGGELRLDADRSFEVDLKIKAKPDAEPPVQNLVRTLGQPDTQGYFHIKTREQL